MPYLAIKTNVKLSPDQRKELLRDASQTVSTRLGKPEKYVMISYTHCADMSFAGSDAPLAYLELKSIGLPEAETATLANTLSQLLALHMPVHASRVYIEFSSAERHLWGWNSGTF